MPDGPAPVIHSRLRLSNGAEAAIRCAQPPLPADEARRFARFVGHFLVEEYLNDILLGKFSKEACFTAGMGLLGDQVLATCWSGWGREFPDIAVMGGVATAEAYRGQGLASAVVGAVCERFDSARGRLLCLGTSNPAARRIYERLGFRPVAGQILCRAARGARLDEGFAAGRTRGRAAGFLERHGLHRPALPAPAPMRARGRGHRAAFRARRGAASLRAHFLGLVEERRAGGKMGGPPERSGLAGRQRAARALPRRRPPGFPWTFSGIRIILCKRRTSRPAG